MDHMMSLGDHIRAIAADQNRARAIRRLNDIRTWIDGLTAQILRDHPEARMSTHTRSPEVQGRMTHDLPVQRLSGAHSASQEHPGVREDNGGDRLRRACLAYWEASENAKRVHMAHGRRGASDSAVETVNVAREQARLAYEHMMGVIGKMAHGIVS
jgi:hypothetical protein